MFRRISGNAASDKNIKENVCAQMEKNFARAKWKVIIYARVVLRFVCSSSCVIAHQGKGIVLLFNEEHSKNDDVFAVQDAIR